ncbi:MULTISPECIES: 3-oxoacyl-ACP reductase [unclassified Pseudomonas]|uniref:3-oxoacyl-ACP reductase n=1 Tax=unclassified Pseudomonas TaxID=196821 RepID=UPI000BC65FDB|nr:MULTISPECIES: 3-oxoacyl-ACP reductase [unclassified Pseudomonas]PVZ09795.1 3-oxoacyl-[acyl-carrier protein] reductase [Pseudomonas sp. URIL14HWK12:I12]PVZ21449.1 3-oxoacyl-[acyl-carrier protein] reductase [Pseudomonas sp. URIL14HWK12:I10]PVZ30370.1 3-oxoacyl-[acyl-carrier protein] reductase [Pseudomonas sp. URIL14HWK12:I11]SNZ18667.1 3-oxoacyl-[acyl-carrier protein] reductase [Pseudomonas sp. URIL14HWK12:I9]
MNDPYLTFVNSQFGRTLARAVGLPQPAPLERWQPGEQGAIGGPLLVGGGPLSAEVATIGKALAPLALGFQHQALPLEQWQPDSSPPIKAVVFDASGLRCTAELSALPQFFQPLMRHLASNARVLILGRLPDPASDSEGYISQRALEGFSRSLAKELRDGGTAQLLYIDEGAEPQLEGALRFFLSAKSAYISGQVLHLRPTTHAPDDWVRPLAGRRALVTGAARGIGAAIAETLARDGAKLLLVDLPGAKADLDALAQRLGGQSLALDIASDDAPATLVSALGEGLDILVHNAGITRDKTVANLSPDLWAPVIAINLEAPRLITEALFAAGTLRNDARVVLLGSVSAIGGNRGQANYAASKAGLVALAHALAPRLGERGIGISVVAPGFIETQMTDQMPFALREAGRRMNVLGQGGQPQDVAEAVAWLAQPVGGALSGQVLRVCGHSYLGA